MMPVSPLALDVACTRDRQRRLADRLTDRHIDVALLTRAEHVQYLTAFRPATCHQAIVLVFKSGRTILCAPNAVPVHFVADDVLTYEAQWNCTLRQDQLSAALKSIQLFLTGTHLPARVGYEISAGSIGIAEEIGLPVHSFVNIEPELWTLRRKKDPDELKMIRRAIACTDSMYQRAREFVVPGVTEIEIYNQLTSAAVHAAGEPLTALGNDFQCNSPGGPPRHRAVQAGELLILDLGPAYRGYYTDNCRTFAVGQQPTTAQVDTWGVIVECLEFVERQIQPGVSASELYREVACRLDRIVPGGFPHHLGHGIGLSPHETPHLNDHWNDLFQEGDVFTAEPGLYSPELMAGIRLEQDYLVTSTGLERLTSFPLEL